ncbi:MAG: ATP-binding protein, partial [Arcobacteraceae bacterium]
GGIKNNVLPKIFEPYFTTKESSKGTGIGLYMCKEIIVKHLYGNIDVKNVSFGHDNENYMGAEFKIEIIL